MKILLLFILSSFPLGIQAQSFFRDSVYWANENIYRYKFQSADSAIKKLNESHPNDYLVKLLEVNYYWWKIISGDESEENTGKYYLNLERCFMLLEPVNKKYISNDTLYALITTYAYKARIHSMHSRYFLALAELNSCIGLIKQSFGREKFEWFELTSGLYYYYMEAVKKNYPFLIPYLILFPKGDKEKGLSYLEEAKSSNNSILSSEASYFLMKIYLEEERNFQLSRIYSVHLIQKYPQNLLFRYYLFKSFLEENNLEGATRELSGIIFNAQNNPQISQTEKIHFAGMAREDLKKYFLRK